MAIFCKQACLNFTNYFSQKFLQPVSRLRHNGHRSLLQGTRSYVTCSAQINDFRGIFVNKISYLRSSSAASFHTSQIKNDLMEFFDDEKNWGESEVKTGRSWRKEEMRIKSNSDLHKLWYVLLKERNMLMTMQHEYKRLCEPMPNPERIDKVEESMKNLEEVVRERNRAYYLLETGQDGERPTQLVENALGMHRFYRLREYPIPHELNKKWQEDFLFNNWDPPHVLEFKKLLREKATRLKNSRRRHNRGYIKKVLQRYPHVTKEAFSEKFPDVDIESLRKRLE